MIMIVFKRTNNTPRCFQASSFGPDYKRARSESDVSLKSSSAMKVASQDRVVGAIESVTGDGEDGE